MPSPELVQVDFEPVGRRVDVPVGTSVLDAARRAGVGIASICGGEATCGRCRVVVMTGTVSPLQAVEREYLTQQELDAGERLACRAHARGDVKIAVPRASLVTDQRLQVAGTAHEVKVEAAVRAYEVEPEPPTMRDLRSDLDRVAHALETAHGLHRATAEPAVVRQLSALGRRTGWQMTAYTRGHDIVGVAERDRRPVGFAADLGTTKIAGYLVDLETGEELAASGIMNPQIGYGEDVISRLAYAARSAEGGGELANAVRAAIDGLVESLVADADVTRDEIADACIVGNTAMHHLLLELPTGQLARAPFVAAASGALDVRARDVGLHLAPGALVHLPPCIGGFVGADHVAMVMASDLDKRDRVVIGVDIGTNTEIALATPHLAHITSASCASGPAFEGAHIRDGMRAASGAIEAVRLDDGRVELTTIAGAPAVGICGSGIVDAIAELRRTGRINERGRFQPTAAGVRVNGHGPEFVLAPAATSGTGRDIVLNQADVNEIQLAKGAIAAGIDLLLDATRTAPEDVDELIVAGAFGTYLNLDSAMAIGLLPQLPRAVVRQVGNAAGVGAKAALLSVRERARAQRIARETSYLELTTYPSFQRQFARSMLFPASAPRRS